jgi:16S rRNA (uracil1498-N3)-methyltransferase
MELGVTSIQPVAAQRSVVKLSADRADKKMAHWQGIITAAAEQCGRNRLAQLHAPVSLNSWLAQQDMHKRIMLSPRAETSLADWARHHPPQAISLLIGPEGGLSRMKNKPPCDTVYFAFQSARALRTETAGLASIALLNGIWGGM